MLGRSHTILGATATAAAMTVLGTTALDQPITFMLLVGVGTMAALFPDIDSPHNTFRKTLGISTKKAFRDIRNRRRRTVLQRIIDIIQIPIALIFDFIDKFIPHRGPTHWGVTAGLFTFLAYWCCRSFQWPDEVWIAVGVGYFSHLLGDGVTRQGVRFFAPVYHKYVRFLPRALCVRTGTTGEIVMLSFLVAAIMGLMFWILL